LGDVLRELEGDMLIVDPPLEPETPLQRCVREQVFDKINESIAEAIDQDTLASLAERGLSSEEIMYFI
jgi:DNA-binding IscR family transcriptional regulator